MALNRSDEIPYMVDSVSLEIAFDSFDNLDAGSRVPEMRRTPLDRGGSRDKKFDRILCMLL